MNEDIAADVSYALQQVVEAGSGTAALALGPPGRRQDRHLDQRPPATSCRPGSPATPRRWRRRSSTSAATASASSTAGCRRVLRRRLPGRDLDRGDEARHGRARGGGLPADPAYVDGDAPTDGHEPAPPTPTKKPSRQADPVGDRVADRGADRGADDRAADARRRRPPRRRRRPTTPCGLLDAVHRDADPDADPDADDPDARRRPGPDRGAAADGTPSPAGHGGCSSGDARRPPTTTRSSRPSARAWVDRSGSRAARHPWWTPVRVVLAITALCVALGMVQKAGCYGETWSGDDALHPDVLLRPALPLHRPRAGRGALAVLATTSRSGPATR